MIEHILSHRYEKFEGNYAEEARTQFSEIAKKIAKYELCESNDGCWYDNFEDDLIAILGKDFDNFVCFEDALVAAWELADDIERDRFLKNLIKFNKAFDYIDELKKENASIDEALSFGLPFSDCDIKRIFKN